MPICAIRCWRNIISLLIVIRKQLFISISPKVSFSNIKVEILVCIAILVILVTAITYYIRILRKAYSRSSEAMEKAEQANQLKSAFWLT